MATGSNGPGSTGHPIAINVRRNTDFPASLGR